MDQQRSAWIISLFNQLMACFTRGKETKTNHLKDIFSDV